jgi:hypothetical protein
MKGRVGLPQEALVLWVAILHLCSLSAFLELVIMLRSNPAQGFGRRIRRFHVLPREGTCG